jgi:hypothetical protein
MLGWESILDNRTKPKGPTTKSGCSHDLGNSNNFSTEPKGEKNEKAKSYQDNAIFALDPNNSPIVYWQIPGRHQ